MKTCWLASAIVLVLLSACARTVPLPAAISTPTLTPTLALTPTITPTPADSSTLTPTVNLYEIDMAKMDEMPQSKVSQFIEKEESRLLNTSRLGVRTVDI